MPKTMIRLTEGAKAYDRAQKAYIKRRNALMVKYDAQINRIVKETMDGVVFNIKNVSAAEWGMQGISRQIDKLDNEMAALGQRMAGQVNTQANHMMGFTLDGVDGAVAKAGWKVPTGAINPRILDGERLLIKQLVKDFTTTQAQQLGTMVNLGIQNGDSTLEVAKRIEQRFGQTLSKRRPATGVFHQANRMARTEVLRVNSMVDHERSRQVEKLNPTVRKIWVSTHKPDARPDHEQMEAETRANPIAIDALFELPDGEVAMFPRAPSLSAKNTVNCSCYEQLVEVEE